MAARDKNYLHKLGWAIRHRKEALMRRDPLGQRLTHLFRELRDACEVQPAPPEAAALWQECLDVRRRLEDKYDVGVEMMHPDTWRAATDENFPSERVEDLSWFVQSNEAGVDREQAMIARTNFPLPHGLRAVPEFPLLGSPPFDRIGSPADGVPPTVTFSVNLTRVRDWDLERLARRMKEVVRLLRGMLPEDAQKTPSEARHDPLAFLRGISPKKFSLYLRRYDLHTVSGLTFRQVAALEAMERAGHAVEKHRMGHIGRPVRGEDSVEKAVKLIHQAIMRTPYRARRRRLDSPAQGAPIFACRAHPGGDCDRTCTYLRAWWRNTRPTLPSDSTGRLRISTRAPRR